MPYQFIFRRLIQIIRLHEIVLAIEQVSTIAMSNTSIAVEPKTRDNLRALKTGGQTYDDVLVELMEHYEES